MIVTVIKLQNDSCLLGPPVAITQRASRHVLLLFLFFSFFTQREISAVSRPIAAKHCHMIGNGCNFNKKAQLSLTNTHVRKVCTVYVRAVGLL